MVEADVDQIGRIEGRIYEFPWSEAIFRDCLHAGYHCVVLQLPAGIVGYGVMSAGAGECHLLNLSVAPAWQGRGLGTLLIRSLLEAARTLKARVALLEVRATNADAQRLYRRLGFEQIGRRKGYYPAREGREDALVLARVI